MKVCSLNSLVCRTWRRTSSFTPTAIALQRCKRTRFLRPKRSGCLDCCSRAWPMFIPTLSSVRCGDGRTAEPEIFGRGANACTRPRRGSSPKAILSSPGPRSRRWPWRHHGRRCLHYLHHTTAGQPYPEPNAMGNALLAAAGDAGVRITLSIRAICGLNRREASPWSPRAVSQMETPPPGRRGETPDESDRKDRRGYSQCSRR